MQDSFLEIIKYILKKKNISNNDQSIDSFFSNGISFPIFVSKILDDALIPDINKNPTSKLQCDDNNNKALLYLFENNEIIKQQNPSLKTEDDRFQLLKLIFTEQCFLLNSDDIITKLNENFKLLQIQLKNEDDLFQFQTLSLLLHILTKQFFPKTKSFKKISQICKKSQIPLFIKENSIEKENSFIFLIQIQIFYDYFSNCSQKKLEHIQEQIQKILNIYKNKSKNSVNFVETNSCSNMAEKWFVSDWNYEIPKYTYQNGILCINDEHRSKYHLKRVMQNADGNKNNFKKIFKFDENKMRWIFCESEYVKLFGQSNQNPQIKLVTFLNTDFQSALEISFHFKNDIFTYDFGNEISIFGFKSENYDNDSIFFLFLYVPESKINNEHLRLIFYQIYTFLFLISDYCLTNLKIECDLAFEINIIKMQLSFIKKIKKIGENYLNEECNGKKIFNGFSEPNFIWYRIEGTTQLNLLFKFYLNDDYKLHFVESDLQFYRIFSKCEFKKNYRYKDLQQIFKYCNEKFTEISEGYLLLSLDEHRDEEKTKAIKINIITKQFKEICSNPKYSKEQSMIIEDIKKESLKFFPQCDSNFLAIFEFALLQVAIENGLIDQNLFFDELQKESEKHLKMLENRINQKRRYDENELDAFCRGHQIYLQKQFFEILKKKYGGAISLAYKELYEMLDSQILADNKKILSFYEKYKNLNTAMPEKFNSASRRGANYIEKEVETTRQIEVVIDDEDDLNKVIPQDF